MSGRRDPSQSGLKQRSSVEGWLNRWNIIRQTRALETDILHITGDIHFAALAWPKWRRNRPQVVLTIHDIGFIHDHTGWKRWLMKKIWITWPLRCVDQLITVSEATKEAVLKEASWFDPRRSRSFPPSCRSISNHGKLNPTTPNPLPCTSELPRTKTCAVMPRRFEGLDVHLRIIGEPSDADHRMLKQLGVEYSTQSKLTDAEMQEAYATSDFLLFASTLEGFGMPILEAQMVGLPVITSHICPHERSGGRWSLVVRSPWIPMRFEGALSV